MPARFIVGAAIVAFAGLTVPAAMAETAAAIFTGFRSTSKEPINVDAKTLEISEVGKQRLSVFTGGVVIRRGDTTLKAATVTIYEDLDAKPQDAGKPRGDKAAGDKTGSEKAAGDKPAGGKPAPKRNPFSRIEAVGKVMVTSGAQTVTGDKAVFNTAANTIVLAGNVVLQQGTNHITGDRLTIDLTSGMARVEQTEGGGRIKGQFTPGSNPLQDKPGGTPPPEAKPGG